MSTAKPAKPSSFDGSDTSRMTIVTWSFDVSQYLKLTKTPDDEQVPIAASYLSGAAKTWFITTYTDPATYPDLRTFLGQFKANFSSATDQDDVIRSLEGIRMANCSINEYVSDFKLLVNQLENRDSPDTKRWVRLCFLRGLSGRLAELLVNDLSDQDSVNDICTKALKKSAVIDYAKSLRLSNLSKTTTPESSRNARSFSSPRSSGSQAVRVGTPTKYTSNTKKPFRGKLSDEEKELLDRNKGCYSCRKINAGHGSWNCPEYGRDDAHVNVKKEVVSIVDRYVVRQTISESDSESNAYHSVPVITIPTRIQSATVNSGVDCGASINVISPATVKKYDLVEQLAVPVRIHQAMDPNGTTHSTKVVSAVAFPTKSWESSCMHEFTVAPLSNHDALLGMPFLAKEGILVNPAERTLILPDATTTTVMPSVTPEGYVRVGNAFMKTKEDYPPPAEMVKANKSMQAEFIDVLVDDAVVITDGVKPKQRVMINRNRTAAVKLPTEVELEELETKLRSEYIDIFADELPNQLPAQDGPRHRIILKDEKKEIKGRMMRIPNRYLKAFKIWLDGHVKAGRLVPSKSHISSGTFLRPKKDPNAFPRVVHDYRALNENTVKDHTPLPRQEQILEKAAQAFVRGSIDLVSGYYQHWVHKKDRHKTAILTPWGLYEWTVMPQGLCNAVASFQRYMRWVLRAFIGVFCEVYLDDILIYSDSLEDHERHVRLILETLRRHGLIASKSKSHLFADRIEFLGHYVSSKGLEPDSSKLNRIMDFPVPRSVEDIKSFLGLVNYLAMFDFIPGLADHSSVLTELTKKGKVFEWRYTHQKALETIKRLVKSVRFLQRINYESGEPVWLVADASSKGIGGYVAQGKDWKTARPIGFYSRQYRSAEANYPTHEQEMLAVVECMKHWYPQLMGMRFEVLTDHAPLRHWRSQRLLSRRQLRWLDFLANFDFDIAHIPGISNTAADALSRYPFAQESVNEILTIEIDPQITTRIIKAYKEDTLFGPVIRNPTQYSMYEVTDAGLLYTKTGRLCVPSCKTTRELLLQEHHD